MNVNGEYRIPASQAKVWEALHDPETLRACVPGCEDLQRISETEFEGRLTAQVGAVTTVFTGRLLITDEKHPQSWAMTAQVRSASAGWADGQATVTLTAETSSTVLGYRARIEPGGRLASVGGRLLHGVAIRMANEFFARFIERLRAHPVADEPQELAEPVAPIPPRIVTPLAPTSAPSASHPVHITPPRPSDSVPGLPYQGEGPTPRQKNRTLAIGTTLWVIIFVCLFWPLG